MEWNAWCLLPIEAFVSGKNHRFHESLLSSSLERIVLESVNRHSGLNVSLSDQRKAFPISVSSNNNNSFSRGHWIIFLLYLLGMNPGVQY
jgi:hypothetical protein